MTSQFTSFYDNKLKPYITTILFCNTMASNSKNKHNSYKIDLYKGRPLKHRKHC